MTGDSVLSLVASSGVRDSSCDSSAATDWSRSSLAQNGRKEHKKSETVEYIAVNKELSEGGIIKN
jgi:hypothetical protein